MTKIAAGIVTYNPSLDVIPTVISAVYDQADLVVVVDNASENVSALERLAAKYAKVRLIKNSHNAGVAGALNQLMTHAESQGAEWVLTLDQDSIVPDGLVETFALHADYRDVGIVCPRVLDRNFSHRRAETRGVREVSECITSGSLTNVTAWRRVGGFDDKLFIDFVDFDFCLSLRESGFRIVRVCDVVLSHQLGNSRIARFLGRDYVAYNHDPSRRYYFARNLVYYTRKHRGSVNTCRMYASLIERTVITFFMEDMKWEKLSEAIRGIQDSRSM